MASDAQYVIEVASQVSGVDATAAELDSLASKLSGSGVRAAKFEDAITKLSSDLDRARAASSAANASLAEGQTKYAQLEMSAVKAAKAVEKMEVAASGLGDAQDAVNAAQGKLDAAVAEGAGAAAIRKLNTQLRKAQKNLDRTSQAANGLGDARAAADAAGSAVSAYAKDLDRLKQEAMQAAQAQGQLEDSLQSVEKLQKRVNDRLGDAATNLSTFRGALGDIGGPIAEFGERLMFPAQAFVDLNEKFGRSTAIATVAVMGFARVITAVVSALVAVGAALVAGTAALVGFALHASNAARSLGLVREAAEVTTPALKGLPWADITDATGLADDRLRDLSSSLLDAGVSASELPAALRAAATAEAALGQGGADDFVASIKAGEESVHDLAAAVERDFGGIVARKMLGLEAQGARLKRNLGGLFDGFEIEGALEGLSTIVNLFDENTAAGKAMKGALDGILQPIIDQAKNAAVAVEAFVLGFLIGATKVYLKAKPSIDAISELLGLDGEGWDLDEVLDTVAAAGEKVAPTVLGIVAVIGALAAAIGVGVAALIGINVAFFEMNKAIGRAIAAVAMAVADFVTIGADIVAGLVSGILSGASSVISAITGVVGGAIDAAKSALGIASPSKIFAEMGEDTGEGYVEGVDSEQDAAHSAVQRLTDPGAATSTGQGSTPGMTDARSSSSRDESRTIIIESLTVDASNAPAGFVEWIESLALRGAT